MLTVTTYELVLTEGLQEIFRSCENACVADCCGLEAFEFSPENFEAWFVANPDRRDAVLGQMRQVMVNLRERTELRVVEAGVPEEELSADGGNDPESRGQDLLTK